MSLQTFFNNFEVVADAPKCLLKLRELSLQLAMQGKLNTQDSNDESACTLLERIKEIKANLIKRRKLKSVLANPILEQEKFCPTPAGWTWARLEDIGQIVGGGTPRSDNSHYFSTESVAWLTPADLYGLKSKYVSRGRRDISNLGLMNSSAQLMPAGTVVFSSRAPIGYVAIASNELATNQGFKSCVPYELEMSEYIYYFLKAETNKLEAAASGTTFKEIPAKQFSQIVIPVPPLGEQKRIVAKIDKLMRLCDELEVRQQLKSESRLRLNNATLAPLNKTTSVEPQEFEQATIQLADNFDVLYDSIDTVGKLRSTILQFAVQGILTPQQSNDEPAFILLDKIKKKREVMHEAKRRARAGVSAVDGNGDPFVIPSTWRWARLGQLAELLDYGTSEKASVERDGVPVLRMNNIEDGTVLLSNLKYVSPTIKDLPRLYLKTDELLFNRTNSYELVGKTGIFKGESGKFTFASYLIRIRLFESVISPDYVNLAMNADYFRRTQINNNVTQQCGQANFNGTKLANTLIPLPPFAEQKRIVARVNRLMALCDDLEAKLRQAEDHSEKLMNAAVQHVLHTISSDAQVKDVLNAAKS